MAGCGAARRSASAVGFAVCLASAACARPEPRLDDPLRPQRFGPSTAPSSQFYDILIGDCILTVINHSEGFCPPGQSEDDTQKIDLRHVEDVKLIPLGGPEGYPELVLFRVAPSSDAPPFDPERSDLPVYQHRRGYDGHAGPEVDGELLAAIMYDDWATHDLLNAVDAALTVCRSAPYSSGGRP